MRIPRLDWARRLVAAVAGIFGAGRRLGSRPALRLAKVPRSPAGRRR